MTAPWLSVLMPVYNGASYLARALESILAQGQPALEGVEIVAVDNSSTDTTLSILQSYTASLPLTVLQQPHAPSWLTGTNLALRAAKGQFISLLHHDDEWEPSRLRRLHATVAERPALDFVIHPVVFVGPSGRRLGVWSCPVPEGSLRGQDVLRALLVQNFLSVPAPIVRRELAKRVNGFDEDLWYTGDWDFWMKVAAAADEVFHLGSPLARYRIHPTSQTSSRSSDVAEFERQHRLPFERHLSVARAMSIATDDVERLGRLSIATNVFLAARAKGIDASADAVRRAARDAGLRGTVAYVRKSRLVDRVMARVRLARSAEP